MARYIDADELIDKIFPIGLIDDGKYTINAKAIKMAVDSCPTADVVPQSEVERLNKELDELAEEHSDLIVEKDELFDIAEKQKIELEAMRGAANSYKMHYENLAREIFEEIEKIYNAEYKFYSKQYRKCNDPDGQSHLDGELTGIELLGEKIAELKKKYIGKDINALTSTEEGE